MTGLSAITPSKLDAMLRSFIVEYPLRQFLLASTSLTPPFAFESTAKQFNRGE